LHVDEKLDNRWATQDVKILKMHGK
jgi:hypothetical protein